MLDTKAWGKLEKDELGNVTARLSLLGHSIDVAAVTLCFLQLPTVRRRLERLAGRKLEGVDLERLALLAFLHDLGKCCAGFQSKSLDDQSRKSLLSASGIDSRGIDCGHTAILGALLHHQKRCQRLAEKVCIVEIDHWGGLDLWLAAVSHHGRPLTFRSTERAPIPQLHHTWSVLGNYDPWKNLKEMGSAARSLFPKAFEENAPDLPHQPEFAHAFAGLVSLSDWIGSDSREHAFPFDLAEGLDRWPLALERAAALLRAMSIDAETIRDELHSRAPTFGDVFHDAEGRPFQPTELQAKMDDNTLGKIVVVESETGSGKTEAALWRFKTLFERGAVDSLAFLLPTRVSAVQIEERVRSFISRLFPNKDRRLNVLLALPGYWRVDGIDAEKALPNFQVLWPDGDSESMIHKRWVAENTKRYLAAGCAIGTIDQLLLAGLQSRHAHLRGFAALRSLLVVDEVHASDAYMTRILKNILQRHHKAGGHALLLSATLGLAARDNLLGRTDRDRYWERPESAPYPAITDHQQELILSKPKHSKSVKVECHKLIDEPALIAEVAIKASKKGARVLIIRNTVNAAIEVQLAIEAETGIEAPFLFRAGPGVVCLHHGRFAAADRRILDQAVENQFGKSSAEGGRLLVGTQTLEQSLDIDCDLLITDLAPIDILLQRIGRLHRHRLRERPREFKQAKVKVLTPKQRDLISYLSPGRSRHGMGPERAYENVPSIDATWELLEKHQTLTIPDQNRKLVEQATDPQRLHKRATARGEDWVKAWSNAIGAHIAGAKAGSSVLCRWDEDWDRSEFPEDDRRIQTRLGIAAARLELLEKWTTPFGQELTELPIPHWMLAEAEALEAQAQVGSSGELTIKTSGGIFKYGRLGLSRYC